MLKSIEISGFKSFAKKSALFFGSRVVGVVGPNGSGKSNVAESFRFVLGEQSMKALRSGKGEDLIWNGSVAVPKANKASVTLVFDNSSRIFAMDLPEITLERAVYRDGQNEYFLNGKQVRLKDITELLASISIGASKHHIISQGQADRMLNSTPAERREMLLDSLGLTSVDLKKGEAERNLNKTSNHMKEVEAARRESKPRLNFLEKQVEKFAKAKKVREELVDKSAQYIRAESVKIQTESRELVALSSEPRKTLTELITRRETLRAQVHAQKDTSREDALYGSRTTAERELAQIESELSNLLRERAKISVRIEIALEPVITALPAQTQASKPLHAEPSFTLPKTALERLRTAETTALAAVRMSGDYSRAFRELQAALAVFWASVPSATAESKASAMPQKNTVHDNSHIATRDPSEYIAQLKLDDAELNSREVATLAQQADVRAKITDIQSKIANLKVASVEGEREILELSATIAELTSRVRELDFTAQNLQSRKGSVIRLQEECEALLGNVFRVALGEQGLTLVGANVASVTSDDIQRLKIRVEELGGSDDEVEREYTDAKQRDTFLQKELTDVQSTHDSLITLIAQLESEMAATFTNGLHSINESFETFFKSLFGGGEAKLVETEEKKRGVSKDSPADKNQSEDDEEKPKIGIDIEVHLPKKKVSSLAILSGGERALTSIALICALSQVNPPPFIILDETDAALDESNSARFANMVQTLSTKSQCIVITHNRATMAAAGELYGITMGSDGVSKLLSVKLEEAERVAK
jgi:chromosome segregation ATPase